jgi:catechol-2,3-dioxygenase
VARLHHLALGAKDVVNLANFYAQAFELSVLQTHLHEDRRIRSVWLDLSPGVLMIEHTEDEQRSVQGVGSGFFLIAFQVFETEKEACSQRIVTAGGKIDGRSEHSIYARDLENNRIAISSYALPQ